MADTFLRLLVVLLCFSHLICNINAVPISRIRSLDHQYQGHQLSENTRLEKSKERWEVHPVIRRMAVELNDYPGPGANNHHTPKPEPGKGCPDC
ncbi:unnamed protein product [Ilex paraguariensis]|uniref:Uncharacterized protein n=1 Tax=Ilex paraguariensis TaxID=185542 RepID=A0ABC8SNE8_9AQUA